jgi:hypothetical protein
MAQELEVAKAKFQEAERKDIKHRRVGVGPAAAGLAMTTLPM